MKPVMFCTNSNGMSRWLHSWMNCAPFCDSSEKRMPLLAMHADRVAPQRGPSRHELGAVQGLELVELAGIDDSPQDLAHVEGNTDVGRCDPQQLGRIEHRCGERDASGKGRACAS